MWGCGLKFNVNNYVKVKLTELGKQELKKRYIELSKWYPESMKLEDFKLPEVDEKGFSKWQLHVLISTFGGITGNGFNPPFETEIEIIEGQ